MMGDKCAELVRAAMIGALAVTLGNPTAVYAAEEETADPGQIGIEIAGEAAVGAASFCVEEDAAEKAPAEAEEVTEPEGTQNDEMEEESGSEGKEDETVPEEPEPQEPDGGENAGMTEPKYSLRPLALNSAICCPSAARSALNSLKLACCTLPFLV